MKHVAILTTHRANNFGAVLQAYSLVRAVCELGADGQILDYRCPFYEWLYHRTFRISRNPFFVLKHALFHLRDETPACRLFADFRGEMSLTNPVFDREGLVALSRQFDAMIVGSDQVWNPINSAKNPILFDRRYLLDFVPDEKKFAYAASIGVKAITPTSIVPEFVQAWRTFQIITMRENVGADIVSRAVGHPVETVLDPVLLHDTGFWDRVATAPRSNPYVFVYNVRRSIELLSAARSFAKEKGFVLVDALVPGQCPRFSPESKAFGPKEFIGYVQNASAVFTNSFHASAFSVLFGRNLYLQRCLSGDLPNSRFDTLLDVARVSGTRYITSPTSEIMLFDCSQSDYSKLNRARIRSFEVLREMVV